jgi:hypothetical protein
MSRLLASITGSIDATEEFFRNEKATGTVTCASVIATDTVTVNGLVYTAVAGAKANNTEFSVDTGDNECATDLADSITNDVRAGVTTSLDVTATSATNVVTIEETVGGTGGNSIDLSSSNGTRLAVSGAFLTGGTTPAYNTDFSVATNRDRVPNLIKIYIHAQEAATLSIAYDGSNYVTLGGALTANVPTSFTVPVNDGDVINLQSDINITLNKCSIYAIQDATD